MAKKIRYPFGTITITKKAKSLVKKILDTGQVSQGRYVRELEERFAQVVGVKEAVAVSSGTDADMIALSVLYDYGAKRGDEVIVPALSFVATANAIVHAGFKPVFVDVKEGTYNIFTSHIPAKLTSKTRAIMPVHLMGKPAEMNPIMDIAKLNHLYVIEDAAEAHGAGYATMCAGSMGDMAAFSLYLAHIITSGEGGIITTNNSDFAEIARSLRAHGRGCSCKRCVLNTNPGSYCEKRFRHGADSRFSFERIGFSSKMNELEAAIGLGAIEIYDEILGKRRKNLEYLMNNFRKFKPYLTTFNKETHEQIGPHAFPIVLGYESKYHFTRDEYAKYLEKNGIETRAMFASMPTQYPSFRYLGYKLGDFPNAEYIGNNGLHIGVHQDLTREHLDYFLDVTDKFIKEKTRK